MVIIRLKCTETELLVISGWFRNKSVFDRDFIYLFLLEAPHTKTGGHHQEVFSRPEVFVG